MLPDQHDALNDYLDLLAGAPPTGSRAGVLDDTMHDGVDQFFDLAEQSGYTPRANNQSRRPSMNATLPASSALPLPNQKRRFILPGWTEHLHLLSTGLLIGAVIALSFAAFGPNRLGSGNGGTGNGDGPGHFSAVPVATVPDDAVTSSIPYPTADECTVEPMTRDEIIQAVIDGNKAPVAVSSDTHRDPEPSEDEALQILRAYREYQACTLKGYDYAFALLTPFGMYQSLGFFPPEDPNAPPPTKEDIANRVDMHVYPFKGGTPPPQPTMTGTTTVPHFENATHQTMFAEDIRMHGPDAATAVAYWVLPSSRELQYMDPTEVSMVRIEGQWLIDFTHRGLARG